MSSLLCRTWQINEIVFEAGILKNQNETIRGCLAFPSAQDEAWRVFNDRIAFGNASLHLLILGVSGEDFEHIAVDPGRKLMFRHKNYDIVGSP
jgi:hypothetical protein